MVGVGGRDGDVDGFSLTPGTFFTLLSLFGFDFLLFLLSNFDSAVSFAFLGVRTFSTPSFTAPTTRSMVLLRLGLVTNCSFVGGGTVKSSSTLLSSFSNDVAAKCLLIMLLILLPAFFRATASVLDGDGYTC